MECYVKHAYLSGLRLGIGQASRGLSVASFRSKSDVWLVPDPG
jgi:hypothetical protein